MTKFNNNWGKIEKMTERITIILGAGAMCEATKVSTDILTKEVIRECKDYSVSNLMKISLVDAICEKYLELYSLKNSSIGNNISKEDEICKTVNFEDIFHTLEIIPNYIRGDDYINKNSAYKIFTSLSDSFKCIDKRSIYGSSKKIVDVINDKIYSYDSIFNKKGQGYYTFFSRLLEETRTKFDVFNLNYDTWMEQTLNDYNDGFVNFDESENIMQRFDANAFFFEKEQNIISHLHGQINFGYLHDSAQRNSFFEGENSLYKYFRYEDAKKARELTTFSSEHTQSGENLLKTNIVTGLMKTDKLLWSPLNIYHAKLATSLIYNRKLLIIGYGFSDLYINNLLVQYLSSHKDDRQIVMIDYVSDEQWSNVSIEHPFRNVEQAEFSNRMFENDGWYKRNSKTQIGKFEKENGKISCIYRNGFNDVIKNHLSEIIDYFSL